ncbi:MAG: HU family DNA-binding protein [Dysgonamonadaceae bacterium]|jgi:nucleoid DNA-binding protein|nr:HU family DNA-binding protein [Dysgonamonadaceae bacterium]
MNEKIGLQDLVVLLAEKSNITKKDAEILVKECFETMEEGLLKDKLLKVRNLGTFKLVRVEDRESVDVSTGERVLIPAHYKVSFSPDTELADKVNEPYNSFENVEIEDGSTVDDETDDETGNDDETEEKLVAPVSFPEEPEIKETGNNQDEEAETEKQEPETAEIGQNEIIDKEQMYMYEEDEPDEPAYSEQYDENDRPEKSNKKLFWIFIFIASAILLVIVGYYLRPIIEARRSAIPDSVLVFSYSINKPQISDHSTVDAPDSATPKTQSNVAPKTQTTGKQPAKTHGDKQYQIRNGERLNTIALREYGHKAFWVYIYDENRSKIGNPDVIEPGMVISIPPAAKYGIDVNNRESVEKALELEQKYKKQ